NTVEGHRIIARSILAKRKIGRMTDLYEQQTIDKQYGLYLKRVNNYKSQYIPGKGTCGIPNLRSVPIEKMSSSSLATAKKIVSLGLVPRLSTAGPDNPQSDTSDKKNGNSDTHIFNQVELTSKSIDLKKMIDL
ncbi:MAG: hypothetical protein AAF519_19450, partial [Bacteroidota bacterium]